MQFRLFAAFAIFVPLVAFAATTTVTVGPQGQMRFTPSAVTIPAGDTIQWTWGSNNHSTTSGSGTPNGLWNSGVLSQGSNYSRQFTTPGTFPYYCTVHGASMNGTITVTATPTP